MKTWYALALLIGLAACKNDSDNPDQTPAGGKIQGSVTLFDDRTNPLDDGGMTVSVQGTTPLRQATTTSTGSYTIENVPTGNYTLVFEKAEYGTFRMFDINHNATGTTPVGVTPSLGKISTTTITALSAAPNGSAMSVLTTTSPAASGSAANRRVVRYFLHTANTVNNTTYTAYTQALQIGITPYPKIFTREELNSLGFASGSTVWVKAYGESFFTNEYDDPTTNRRVFPNLNPTSAAAVSFVVP